ncbi:hypothetical protein R82526_01928 [Ralstonia mannitolilytica]|nr:hypothetical protein [Ralstonia mannitolilytica]CAJ0682800.1 hypothetical protein R82526_01928 [Ralstonia mannitolilytica]CAJ0850681.1 hypothetical protein R76727_00460 [Ralstonia mannitolilytica]
MRYQWLALGVVLALAAVVALRNYKAQDVKGGLGRGGQLKVN